jgi:hypothetical protein
MRAIRSEGSRRQTDRCRSQAYKRRDASILAMELMQFMGSRGVGGNDIVVLYGCGNWRVRYGNLGNRMQWEAEMQEVAAVLGFRGPARGFDTGIIDPVDGTYVEYHPIYNQSRCRIYYKRNEKMDYQKVTRKPSTGGFNPDIARLANFDIA